MGCLHWQGCTVHVVHWRGPSVSGSLDASRLHVVHWRGFTVNVVHLVGSCVNVLL